MKQPSNIIQPENVDGLSELDEGDGKIGIANVDKKIPTESPMKASMKSQPRKLRKTKKTGKEIAEEEVAEKEIAETEEVNGFADGFANEITNEVANKKVEIDKKSNKKENKKEKENEK